MNGIAAQERGTLDDVIIAALADDDRTQAHPRAAGTIDEDAGEQATDATEAVEDDIANGAFFSIASGDRCQLRGEEVLDRGRLVLQLLDEATQVDSSGTEIEFGQSADDLQGLFDVEILAEEVAGIAVSLDHSDH